MPRVVLSVFDMLVKELGSDEDFAYYNKALREGKVYDAKPVPLGKMDFFGTERLDEFWVLEKHGGIYHFCKPAMDARSRSG